MKLVGREYTRCGNIGSMLHKGYTIFTVAGQLALLLNFPFFHTWLIVGLGGFFSIAIEGFVIYFI